MKDLSEIASISGKGGLYRILKPGRAGIILESMDEKKARLATNPNHKVSVLADISIYTNTDEGSKPLEEVLRKVFKEFGDDPGIDGKSTPEELISFIEYIIPEYDASRVYPSDVKKLVNWYKILLKEVPEFFEEEEEKNDDQAPETDGTEKKDKKEHAGKAGKDIKSKGKVTAGGKNIQEKKPASMKHSEKQMHSSNRRISGRSSKKDG